MMLPRIGEQYPLGGRHATHVARITAIDTHGVPSWIEDPELPPTIAVACSCGIEFADDLVEVVERRVASSRRRAG